MNKNHRYDANIAEKSMKYLKRIAVCCDDVVIIIEKLMNQTDTKKFITLQERLIFVNLQLIIIKLNVVRDKIDRSIGIITNDWYGIIYEAFKLKLHVCANQV